MGVFSVDDILPMIFRFLIKAGYTKAATKLQKESDNDLSVPTILLHKKKLASILENYAAENPDVMHAIKKRKDSTASNHSAALGKRKMSNASDVSASQRNARHEARKRKQQEDDEEEQENEEEEAEEDEVKSAPKKVVKQEQKMKQIVNVAQQVSKPNLRRIDQKYITGNYESKMAQQVTFEDKLKMGNDELGKFGYERLRGTQGKEFRKQKAKLKNRSSYGGTLTMEDNTLPFE